MNNSALYDFCLRPVWEYLRPYGRYIYYALWPERRPDYFRAPWRFPVAPLDELDSTPFAPAAGDDGSVFVFFPMVDWHARFQRSQQLARALADSGHTCIYVNPELGAEYFAPYAFDGSPCLGTLADNIYELHVHLPRVHVSHARVLANSETQRITSAVEDVFKRCGSREIVQVVSFPRWLDVAERLRSSHGSRIVYDCHDYLPGFGRISPEIIGREDRLLETSDLVVFSSEGLRTEVTGRLPLVSGKSVIIRNAVNPGDFAIAYGATGAAGKRVVGYAGALDSWFDVELMRAVAAEHTDCSFQFLGRIENTRVLELHRLANVEFAGEVPYSDVPKYMSKWSAALIPFIKNPLTDAADLIKLYEYFSLGLPVVGTALAEIERYREFVYIGTDAASFSRCLAEALSESGSGKHSQRRAIALQETWTRRAASLVTALRAHSPSGGHDDITGQSR